MGEEAKQNETCYAHCTVHTLPTDCQFSLIYDEHNTYFYFTAENVRFNG